MKREVMRALLVLSVWAVITVVYAQEMISLRGGYDAIYEMHPEVPLSLDFYRESTAMPDVTVRVASKKLTNVTIARRGRVVGFSRIPSIVSKFQSNELGILGFEAWYELTQADQFSKYEFSHTLAPMYFSQLDAVRAPYRIVPLQFDPALEKYFTLPHTSESVAVPGESRLSIRTVFTPQHRLVVNSTATMHAIVFMVAVPDGNPFPVIPGEAFPVLAPNQTIVELPNKVRLSVVSPTQFNLQIDSLSAAQFVKAPSRPSTLTTNMDMFLFEVKLPSGSLPSTVSSTLSYSYDKNELANRKITESSLRFVRLSESDNSWVAEGEPVFNTNTSTISQPVNQLLGKWSLQAIHSMAASVLARTVWSSMAVIMLTALTVAAVI